MLARGDTLVICEVKTRRGRAFGEWLGGGRRPQAPKLRAVAQAFLQTTGARPRAVRFDVASVAWSATADGSAEVEVFEDAF